MPSRIQKSKKSFKLDISIMAAFHTGQPSKLLAIFESANTSWDLERPSYSTTRRFLLLQTDSARWPLFKSSWQLLLQTVPINWIWKPRKRRTANLYSSIPKLPYRKTSIPYISYATKGLKNYVYWTIDFFHSPRVCLASRAKPKRGNNGRQTRTRSWMLF